MHRRSWLWWVQISWFVWYNLILCTFKKDCHILISEYEDQLGQNVFVLHKSLGRDNATWVLEEAFRFWQRQWRNFSPSYIINYPFHLPSASKVGYYSQIIWAQTKYLGCGRIRYGTLIITKYIVICVYGPSIIQHDNVFEIGRYCSKCPTGLNCNQKYRYLCGEVRNISDDDWSAPFGKHFKIFPKKN